VGPTARFGLLSRNEIWDEMFSFSLTLTFSARNGRSHAKQFAHICKAQLIAIFLA
jgi:hypothetical protein